MSRPHGLALPPSPRVCGRDRSTSGETATASIAAIAATTAVPSWPGPGPRWFAAEVDPAPGDGPFEATLIPVGPAGAAKAVG
jgi:hypothetical protein